MTSIRISRRLLTSALLVLTAAAMMTLVPPLRPASAGTAIVGTVPSDHGVVAGPLDRITLTFDEKITGGKAIVAITGPGGPRLEIGAAKVSGYDVVQRMRFTDARGDVVVGYRLDMPDGQIVTGSFSYSVASGGSTTPPTDPPSVIASALAQVSGGDQGDGAPGTAAQAPGPDVVDVWWKRPWAAAAGAIALLLLAGVAVLSPARSRRG